MGNRYGIIADSPQGFAKKLLTLDVRLSNISKSISYISHATTRSMEEVKVPRFHDNSTRWC
jgi:hypothetical protein